VIQSSVISKSKSRAKFARLFFSIYSAKYENMPLLTDFLICRNFQKTALILSSARTLYNEYGRFYRRALSFQKKFFHIRRISHTTL